MGVGVANPGIEFRIVFQQAVETECCHAQPARDGLLMDAQTIIGRVSIERHSPALKHVAVIGGQDVHWHIETHPVGGACISTTINSAHRQPRSKIDEVDAGGLQRVLRKMPIGNKADLLYAQTRSHRHALRTDIAADRDQRGESVTPLCWWR